VHDVEGDVEGAVGAAAVDCYGFIGFGFGGGCGGRRGRWLGDGGGGW
jgi:hypothetical protein